MKFIRTNYPDVKLVRPEKSFFKWIETKQLPTRKIRWCCEKLKEVGGKNRLVITGIRRAESHRRAKRQEFEDSKSCRNSKVLLNPIIDWSDQDVWSFVRNRVGYYCELYDHGYKRIGCIGCPFNSTRNKIRDFKDNPRYKYPIIKAIKKNISSGKYQRFSGAEDVFDWWISGKSVRRYMADKQQIKIDFRS